MPVVVNITLEGHPLMWGIVVREPQKGQDGTVTIQNWGEGNGELQSNGEDKTIRNAIDGVWKNLAPPKPEDPAASGKCQSSWEPECTVVY